MALNLRVDLTKSASTGPSVAVLKSASTRKRRAKWVLLSCVVVAITFLLAGAAFTVISSSSKSWIRFNSDRLRQEGSRSQDGLDAVGYMRIVLICSAELESTGAKRTQQHAHHVAEGSGSWIMPYSEIQIEDAIRTLEARAGERLITDEIHLTVLIDSRAGLSPFKRLDRTLLTWPKGRARIKYTPSDESKLDLWIYATSGLDKVASGAAPIFLLLTPEATRSLVPNYLEWVFKMFRLFKNRNETLIAGVSPIQTELAGSSKDDFLLEGMSPGAIAPLPVAWKVYQTFFNSAVNDKHLEHWEPHLENLPGGNLSNRRLYRSQCASQFGTDFADGPGNPFLEGLPTISSDKLKKEDKGIHCQGRSRLVSKKLEFYTFFSRFLNDYRLMTILPGSESPGTRSIDTADMQRFDMRGLPIRPTTSFFEENQREIESIVAEARLHGNSVSLTVANAQFLSFAYSWWCNVKLGDSLPPGTIIWVTNDRLAEEGLKVLNLGRVVFFSKLAGAEGKGSDYKMAGYWNLMLSRTLLVRELLSRGITVFLFDLDQVWIRSPWPIVEEYARKNPHWDLIGTRGFSKSETGGEIQGNFLLLRPTIPTVSLWHEISDRFSNAYRSCCEHVSPDTYVGGIEQDQFLLSHLVVFTSYRFLHRVSFVELDRHRFVDGKWYEDVVLGGGHHRDVRKQSPVSIQNNWIVGGANKIDRAKKFRHWFWNQENGTCSNENAKAVLHATSMDQGQDSRGNVYALSIPLRVLQFWNSKNQTTNETLAN
eukprot:CAMPEP_0184686926 /NCGR_PEP_ID=MMETSP0312-20130426/24648_1 /TAXON_ID=31354 /ORGANISM="Compsopogon coeruleus, Strain SAG 36.94" /LENGTH=764 /DNA_ID=CAMNT_0027142553 /DNA_START=610 /DNA_END=2904 /DNA_ORIENTATION=-